MKIAVPILGFGRTGGYRVISNLSTYWSRMGHNVEILVNHSSDLPYFPTEAKVRWLDDWGREVGASAHDVLKDRRGFEQVFKSVRSLWRGLSRHAKFADVILANHSLTAWPVFAARSHARKFYYVQAYEPEYYAQTDAGRKSLLQFVSWLTYFFPLTRIVNSPIYFNYRNLKANVFVPPGIDLDVFCPKQQISEATFRPVRIGCIGRKEPDKGTAYVIEAYEILRARNVPCELHVAYGNIPEDKMKLEALKISVPANDRELAAFYRSVDVLVSPLLVQQGAPHYPVMEAMASGTAVITTGHLPANNANSWIVPLRNARAIADAIVEIRTEVADRRQRIESGIHDVRAYRWDVVAEKMLAEFNGKTPLATVAVSGGRETLGPTTKAEL